MAFINCQNGDLVKNVFITEAELIDRFVGNQLWLWGTGAPGQLGDNNTITRSSPVQTVSTGTNWKQVSLGTEHSSAIKTDGTLWLWGNNNRGQLGNNNVSSRSSPVQTVSTGTNWKQVSLGLCFSAAIKTDGTLWLWGLATGGQTGSLKKAGNYGFSSPVQTVSQGTNWKQVSLGNCHSAAIKTDGTLWIWGCNDSGQLGINSAINHSSPIQTITTGTNWKQVCFTGVISTAIKCDGTLWLWGSGSEGKLGNNSSINHSSPVQTITTGTNWKQVTSGDSHAAAIKIDGTLWLWGSSVNGELGSNISGVGVTRSSPVQTVSQGTNWKQVSVYQRNSAAIKTDGTLWTWGENNPGILGNNDTRNQSSPVQVVSGGTNWKQVSFGGTHAAAITFTS